MAAILRHNLIRNRQRYWKMGTKILLCAKIICAEQDFFIFRPYTSGKGVMVGSLEKIGRHIRFIHAMEWIERR